MSERYDKILPFIFEVHKNQFDKGGSPYVLHPIAVALMCDSESEKVVALLHDVIEDSNYTLEDLRSRFPLSLTEQRALKVLTRDKSMPYRDYIRRIAFYPLAIKVKKADLLHNMDLTRLQSVSQKDQERNKKYKKAYDYLCSMEAFYGAVVHWKDQDNI